MDRNSGCDWTGVAVSVRGAGTQLGFVLRASRREGGGVGRDDVPMDDDALARAREAAERLAPDVPTFRMLAAALADLAGERPLALVSEQSRLSRPPPAARRAA